MKKQDDTPLSIDSIDKTLDTKIIPKSTPSRITQDTEIDTQRFIRLINSSGFSEFIQHLHSPWHIIWSNFLAGVFKGLGILIGMTIVLGVLVAIITQFVNFPLIGEYFLDLKSFLEAIPQPGIY